MPIRRSSARRKSSAFSADLALGFLTGDGTADFGARQTRSFAEAGALWPTYRRHVWLRAPRLEEPGGARYHDGLELQAARTWCHNVTLLWRAAHGPDVSREMTAAIRADRRALAHYHQAHGDELGDVIDLAARDLDALARVVSEAVALAGDPGSPWLAHRDAWRAAGGWRHGEALGLLERDEE